MPVSVFTSCLILKIKVRFNHISQGRQVKCVSISPRIESTVYCSKTKRWEILKSWYHSTFFKSSRRRRERRKNSGRRYFCRYHHNLSVTYFKYLRSFSIRLLRHDCRCLFVRIFAFGLICGAGGNSNENRLIFHTIKTAWIEAMKMVWCVRHVCVSCFEFFQEVKLLFLRFKRKVCKSDVICDWHNDLKILKLPKF